MVLGGRGGGQLKFNPYTKCGGGGTKQVLPVLKGRG